MATYAVQNAGAGNLVKFTATAALNVGDKLSFNGALFDVRDCDGKAFMGKAWDAGDEVILSVCDGFVKLLVPLLGKANKAGRYFTVNYAAGYVGLAESFLHLAGDGMVTLYIAAKANPYISHGDVVLQLPAGLRPHAGQTFLGYATMAEGNSNSRMIAITSYGSDDGTIRLLFTNESWGSEKTMVYGTFTFHANE